MAPPPGRVQRPPIDSTPAAARGPPKSRIPTPLSRPPLANPLSSPLNSPAIRPRTTTTARRPPLVASFPSSGPSSSSALAARPAASPLPKKRPHPNQLKALELGRGLAPPPSRGTGESSSAATPARPISRLSSAAARRVESVPELPPRPAVVTFGGGNSEWEQYRRALRTEEAGDIIPIGEDLWAVSGWDTKKHTLTPKTWYHFRRENGISTCECNEIACVHSELYEHDKESFHLANEEPLPLDPPVAILLMHSAGYKFLFSVSKGLGSHSTKKRTFVWFGRDKDKGRKVTRWKCESCPGGGDCVHKVQARCFARDAIEVDDLSSEEEEDEAGPSDDDDEPKTENPVVSYRERGPPLFARFDPLPDDPNPPQIAQFDALHPTISSPSQPPNLLLLTDNSRCLECKRKISDLKASGVLFQKERQDFVVFYETRAYDVSIEVVRCPTETCHHSRRIGPDLEELGLFNVDNRIGFAREVFDSFLAHFTKSETPFNAFVKATSAIYIDRRSPKKFLPPDRFRAAWYAWARLCQIDSLMMCPECGPSPKWLVADGVANATPRKFVTGNLHPPTRTFPDSDSRPGVKSIVLRPISNTMLGIAGIRDFRKFMKDFDEWAQWHTNAVELPVLLQERLDGLPNSPFVNAFRAFVEWYRLEPGGELRKSVRVFFRAILSEDIILQLFPPRAFELLTTFVHSLPTDLVSVELIRLVPFLGSIANALRRDQDAPFPPPVKELIRLLVNRSSSLFDALLANHRRNFTPSATRPPLAQRKDWQVTGTMAAGDQVRARAVFPKLAKDGGVDKGKDETGCRKLYSLASKTGLTGGIAALWCPHMVAQVYHTMSGSEGRNDIFSAAYCYLREAPEIIAYDYACKLNQYCLVREPEFFKNTLFYVDELHAHGHSNCSSASFIAPAMAVDPELRKLNSSAAECAHSTINRIRKSLRYMKEGNAILLMNSMIHAWNRKILRKLLAGRVATVG